MWEGFIGGFIGILFLFFLDLFLQTLHPYRIPDINLSDQSIRHPPMTETFPLYAVILIFVAAPIILVFLFNLLSRRLYTGLYFTEAILYSQLITYFIVQNLKVWTGELRPDFLSRCFEGDIPSSVGINNRTVISQDDCTSSDTDSIEYGRTSFPSDHASLAFAGATALTLWIAIFLINIPERIENGRVMKMMWVPGLVVFLSLLPFMLATYISVSRVQEYAHHPIDIIAGGLLGIVISAVVLSSYYNALFPKAAVLEENEGESERLIPRSGI